MESYHEIKFSVLEIFPFHFFFFFLHLHFNRLYHTGKCFNLLNTWKVYFRLVMCLRVFIQTFSKHSPAPQERKILPPGQLLVECAAEQLWSQVFCPACFSA